jgi:MOSC domain
VPRSRTSRSVTCPHRSLLVFDGVTTENRAARIGRNGGSTSGTLGDVIGIVAALHLSGSHTFSKEPREIMSLLAGLGVEGDAHCGSTVRHRSRVAVDPSQPNLRQVHLIRAELLVELVGRGFDVAPGDLGENVTTDGVDLESLPTGTLLRLGDSALVALSGLRNPCGQIEALRAGLLGQVRSIADDGRVVRRAGAMAVVLESGVVRLGDRITVQLPPEPQRPLGPV